jgi:hypothetical protein
MYHRFTTKFDCAVAAGRRICCAPHPVRDCQVSDANCIAGGCFTRTAPYLQATCSPLGLLPVLIAGHLCCCVAHHRPVPGHTSWLLLSCGCGWMLWWRTMVRAAVQLMGHQPPGSAPLQVQRQLAYLPVLRALPSKETLFRRRSLRVWQRPWHATPHSCSSCHRDCFTSTQQPALQVHRLVQLVQQVQAAHSNPSGPC